MTWVLGITIYLVCWALATWILITSWREKFDLDGSDLIFHIVMGILGPISLGAAIGIKIGDYISHFLDKTGFGYKTVLKRYKK